MTAAKTSAKAAARTPARPSEPARRGRFITFEGGEGAGKSTQARRLAEHLASLGIHAVLTREPGGSPGAEIIRHVLLSGAAEPFGPEAETILFGAARRDHLNSTILPALQRGDWVICDRFADSTRVYQGLAGKVDPAFIQALERLTVGADRPDLTLVLDLPPKIGLARVANRQQGTLDRFEREGLAFHTKLRQGFKALVEAEPERCRLIDAAREPDLVAADIRQQVLARFDLPARLVAS
ncbi:dTMP kinase [Phreatobacter sp. AB_2022a]|uniref:dTMP kinase n=1 Tax=Phreatobacter sp. AB_2022a TaxID=3003134 RepID=UPI002287129F|nr:dTMP kinase [Phreatobacter sp. AB_2022a]MCZ0736584.1 dTMP kinase [Phreatobacter sp. AB_2022a]